MTQVTVRLLGPVEAEIDGRPRQLGGPQRRAVLALLAVAVPNAVTTDAVIDALWPSSPPATATKAIHKHISALRRALGDQAIETTGGGYRLRMAREDVDAHRLVTALADARASRNPALRSARLRDAVALFGGEPLAGIGDLPFAVIERTRLQ